MSHHMMFVFLCWLTSLRRLWRCEGPCAVWTLPAACGPPPSPWLCSPSRPPFGSGLPRGSKKPNSVLWPSHFLCSSFQPTSTVTPLPLAWLHHLCKLCLSLPTLWPRFLPFSVRSDFLAAPDRNIQPHFWVFTWKTEATDIGGHGEIFLSWPLLLCMFSLDLGVWLLCVN